MAKLTGSIKPWASAANHVVGDYPGEPTKVDGGLGVIAAGFIPGDIFAPTAEETNFELNRYSLVLQWVQDGKATADISAHIVETNALGDINVRRGTFTSNGFGLPAVSGTNTVDGPGVYGESLTYGVWGLGDSYGVRGSATSNGYGMWGRGAGSGLGGYFQGGSTAVGVRGDGGASGAPGATFNGTAGEPDILLTPAANFGIDILCGASALGGVRVLANGQLGITITQDDPDIGAMALFGDGAAVAGVATLDTRAFGAGNALWAVASSGTGYAARFTGKSVAPTTAPIRVDGQTALPSDISSGQLGFVSARGWVHSQFSDFGQPGPGAGWRGFWSSIGGFGLAMDTVPGTKTAPQVNVGSWFEAISVTADAGNAPTLAGRHALLRITVTPRITTANAESTLNLRLFDETADPGLVTPLWSRAGIGSGAGAGYFLGLSTAGVGWLQPVTVFVKVLIPVAGTRKWRLEFGHAGPGGVSIRDISMDFVGVN